ncbi:MAG: septum formation protein Maf [Leptospiraceae bacterium]|nr:septum formation protein Maf [Leptospiraceae bacterium]MCP5493627.1 septum formation protein Maf [Leptospiraceae bacterium]
MLILKSSSPRRIQVLKSLGLKFDVLPANIDENSQPGESYLEYLKRVTLEKLEKEKASKENMYISSDTIVVNENKMLPKPIDFKEATAMLTELEGKNHFVYSGIAILIGENLVFDYDKTEVNMKEWKLKEIREYIEKNQPFDKAGSYGIQDKNGPVLTIKGSFHNVLGFPLRKFYLYHHLWKDFLCL